MDVRWCKVLVAILVVEADVLERLLGRRGLVVHLAIEGGTGWP